MMIETPELKMTFEPTGGPALEFGLLRVIDKITGGEHLRHGVLHRNPQRMLRLAVRVLRGES